MNVLSRLWRAVAGLAESVEALAGTVGEASGRLRQQLALDGPGEAHCEVIDHSEALPAPRRSVKKAPARGKAGRDSGSPAAAHAPRPPGLSHCPAPPGK